MLEIIVHHLVLHQEVLVCYDPRKKGTYKVSFLRAHAVRRE